MLKPIFHTLLGLGLLVSTQGISQRPIKPFLEEPNKSNSLSSKSGQRKSAATLDFGDTPSLSFSGSFGGSNTDVATDIIADASGNVFVCGYFTGQITPDDTPIESTGEMDGFVAKYDNTGELQWWTTLPSKADGFVMAQSIVMDGADPIVVGSYNGNVDFGIDDPLSGSDGESIFYARINGTTGAIAANQSHYDANVNDNLNLKSALDDDGNLYVLGQAGSIRGALLKYDGSDNLSFSQSHDESFTDLLIMGTDLYLSGSLFYDSDGVFNNDISVTTNPNVYSIAMVAKLSLSGDFQWVSLADHEVGNDDYSGESQAYNVTLGIGDELILSGRVRTYGKFDALEAEGSGTFFVEFDNTGSFEVLTYEVDNGTLDAFELVNNGTEGYFQYTNKELTARDADLLEDYEVELEGDLYGIYTTAANKVLRCGEKKHLSFFAQESQVTHVQDFAISVSGNSAESSILAVESDLFGNTYYYGYTTNTLQAFGETMEAGYFLVKVAADESINWVRSLKTDSDRMSVHLGIGDPMKIDPTGGYIYLLAAFDGQLELSNETSLDAHEDGSTAIVKFDTGGNLSTSWKEDLVEYDFDLAVDQEANVILSGIFYNTIELGGESISSKGSSDGFVVKYNASGVAQWTKQLGGLSTEYSTFTDVDDEGNIYVSGEYLSDDIFLNGVSILKAPKGDGNVLLAKLNEKGELQWARVTGRNVEADSHNEDITWPTGIVVDDEGNSYLKGWMAKTIYFDDILLEFEGSNYHHFITKIDNKGNVIWAEGIEQTQGFGFDYNEFEIDALGNVYFAIQATAQINFADDLSYTPDFGYTDLYITKYTSDGLFGWLKVIKGGTEVSQIYGLAVVGTHKICVGGYFLDEITLGSKSHAADNVRSGFYGAFDVSNEAPTFISEPEVIIEAGEKYSYSISTEDKDEMPTLSISALDLPTWLTLTDHGDGTATLGGVPAEENMEDQEISLYVSDAVHTISTKQSFTLTKREAKEVTAININKLGLEVFPNPATSGLTIRVNGLTERASVKINDVSGKLIQLDNTATTISDGSGYLNLISLQPGLYILQVQSNSDRWSQTFIKN
ncbi:MAG: T9SS type A sorting domain-containing protein [Reichenbachiella sp.]|uniref:T9SS type A sorting domain-containing protein n=1 Tax=Reichenbachiella sp. TaxID=2184521 RepID=UPI00296758A0|nr:T9SS type A sorting domain-containing protein [Reichenbachiella sp.]MDW3208566.1 T9SS type A sorting domain-containing protein [Reichenbachiella sp.]